MPIPTVTPMLASVNAMSIRQPDPAHEAQVDSLAEIINAILCARGGSQPIKLADFSEADAGRLRDHARRCLAERDAIRAGAGQPKPTHKGFWIMTAVLFVVEGLWLSLAFSANDSARELAQGFETPASLYRMGILTGFLLAALVAVNIGYLRSVWRDANRKSAPEKCGGAR